MADNAQQGHEKATGRRHRPSLLGVRTFTTVVGGLAVAVALFGTGAASGAKTGASGTPGSGSPQHAAPAALTAAVHLRGTSIQTPSMLKNTASATTTTTTTTPSDSGIIGESGGHLTLNGSTYRFTGVNAYELGTQWGTNAGCGAEVSDTQLDQFFASLRPNSLVRFWAFQGTMATDYTTHQLDWGPLDRVFDAAAAYKQRLIVVLAGQGGGCDGGHWQDPSWYSGGFKDVFNSASNSDGGGLDPLSYWQYMQDVVNRYKDSPALGMWEPISEAEASTCPAQYQPTNCSGHQTCPDEAAAAQAMRYFFDTVGGEIHSLDPKHLVESGTIGSGQCGTSGADYEYVSASPGIDVLSYHDYVDPTVAVDGDQWNGLAVRFRQAAALGKPIIGGEEGIEAGTGSGCMSPQQRASDISNKIEGQLQAGSSGVLVWDWEPAETSTCIYDFTSSDPILGVLSSTSLAG